MSWFVFQNGKRKVRKCSLVGAKHILVDEQIYCVNKNGMMNQTKAMNYCRERYATLPLPLSLLELNFFSDFSSPKKAWIGISDPANSGKKENWRDVQNKKPVYVKLMVKTSNNISVKFINNSKSYFLHHY